VTGWKQLAFGLRVPVPVKSVEVAGEKVVVVPVTTEIPDGARHGRGVPGARTTETTA
jgi:hypothetical protein